MTGVVGMCVALILTSSSKAADDSEARRLAATIGKNAAVSYFEGRKFEIRDSMLQGEAKAVDPEAHVQVSIGEFHLFENRVLLSCTVDGRFSFSGQLKREDEKVKVSGEADVVHQLSAAADFRVEDGKLIVRARANDLKLEVNLRKVQPSDLVGGKQLIESALRKNSDRFLRDINDWLTTHDIGSE
jgi:hypothetical protein